MIFEICGVFFVIPLMFFKKKGNPLVEYISDIVRYIVVGNSLKLIFLKK